MSNITDPVTYPPQNFFLLMYLNITKQVSGAHLLSLLLVPLDNGALRHGRRQARHVDHGAGCRAAGCGGGSRSF